MNKKVRLIFQIILLFFVLTSSFCFSMPTYAQEDDQSLFSQLDGKKAGAMDGTPQDQMIASKVKDPVFSYYKSIPDMALALQQKKIDCYVSPEITFNMMKDNYPGLTLLNALVKDMDISFIFPKTSTALQSQMNEYIDSIKKSGELEKEQNKWLLSDNRDNLTVDIPKKGKNGILHMASCSNVEPYSYIKDNQFVGFDIELAANFCKEYGYGLKIDDMDLGSMIAGISTNKYDFAGGCISYTEERAQNVLYAHTTYVQKLYLVVREDEVSTVGTSSFVDKIIQSFEKTLIKEQRWKLLVRGTYITFLITVASAIFGTILGCILCQIRQSKNVIVSNIAAVYMSFMQGIPVVILLMMMFYVVFSKSTISGVWVSIVAYSLNLAAFVADILRSGIASVDKGQMEAALVMGYKEKDAFKTFVFPQAVNTISPVYRAQLISLLKGTAVVGYIAVQDLTKAGDIIRSRTFEPFFPLITVTLIYFFLIFVLVNVLKFLYNTFIPYKQKSEKSRLLKGVKL